MNITIKRVTDDGETNGDSTYDIYHNLGGMMVGQGHSRTDKSSCIQSSLTTKLKDSWYQQNILPIEKI